MWILREAFWRVIHYYYFAYREVVDKEAKVTAEPQVNVGRVSSEAKFRELQGGEDNQEAFI